MPKQTIYGDEKLGYSILARNLSPKDARNYLITNQNDGLDILMPNERLIALYRRMEEGGLNIN